MRFPLPTADTATDVLGVGAAVWVAAGTSVHIMSVSGEVTKTVNGILGAKGLTVAPDGRSGEW